MLDLRDMMLSRRPRAIRPRVALRITPSVEVSPR